MLILMVLEFVFPLEKIWMIVTLYSSRHWVSDVMSSLHQAIGLSVNLQVVNLNIKGLINLIDFLLINILKHLKQVFWDEHYMTLHTFLFSSSPSLMQQTLSKCHCFLPVSGIVITEPPIGHHSQQLLVLAMSPMMFMYSGLTVCRFSYTSGIKME